MEAQKSDSDTGLPSLPARASLSASASPRLSSARRVRYEKIMFPDMRRGGMSSYRTVNARTTAADDDAARAPLKRATREGRRRVM